MPGSRCAPYKGMEKEKEKGERYDITGGSGEDNGSGGKDPRGGGIPPEDHGHGDHKGELDLCPEGGSPGRSGGDHHSGI